MKCAKIFLTLNSIKMNQYEMYVCANYGINFILKDKTVTII